MEGGQQSELIFSDSPHTAAVLPQSLTRLMDQFVLRTAQSPTKTPGCWAFNLNITGFSKKATPAKLDGRPQNHALFANHIHTTAGLPSSHVLRRGVFLVVL